MSHTWASRPPGHPNRRRKPVIQRLVGARDGPMTRRPFEGGPWGARDRGRLIAGVERFPSHRPGIGPARRRLMRRLRLLCCGRRGRERAQLERDVVVRAGLRRLRPKSPLGLVCQHALLPGHRRRRRRGDLRRDDVVGAAGDRGYGLDLGERISGLHLLPHHRLVRVPCRGRRRVRAGAIFLECRRIDPWRQRRRCAVCHRARLRRAQWFG
jgi:hypothetical protein